jgi:hypothetical protein
MRKINMYTAMIYTKFCFIFRLQAYHQGNRVVSHVTVHGVELVSSDISSTPILVQPTDITRT